MDTELFNAEDAKTQCSAKSPNYELHEWTRIGEGGSFCQSSVAGTAKDGSRGWISADWYHAVPDRADGSGASDW